MPCLAGQRNGRRQCRCVAQIAGRTRIAYRQGRKSNRRCPHPSVGRRAARRSHRQDSMKIVRVTATPLNVPLHITVMGLDRKTSLAACYVEVETDTGIVGHGLTSITEEDVVAQVVNGVIGPNLIGDDPHASRAHLGEGLLDHHAARADRLRRPCAGRGRSRALGHQGQGAEPAGLETARRRASARAGLCHVRLRLFRPRAACGGREKMGGRRLPQAEDDGRERGAQAQGRTSDHGRDPRGREARAGGARGGRTRHRDLHRRQLQSRSLPRHQAGGDDPSVQHLVLRGAADPERHTRHGAASPQYRHRAGLRAERGLALSLPRFPGRRRRSTMRSPMSASPAASPNA